MSLAIFIRATARARRPALAATMASSEAMAANLLGAVTKGRWVSWAIWAAICGPKVGKCVDAGAHGGAPAASLWSPLH